MRHLDAASGDWPTDRFSIIQKVVISAPSGVHVMVLPSFLHRGKIAVVAAYTRNQVSTPTMRVQIRD